MSAGSAVRRVCRVRRLLGLVSAMVVGVAAIGRVAADDVAKPATPTGVEGAMKLVEAGRFIDALDVAKEVPETDASHAKARYVVGEMELLLGDPAAAKEAFDAVIAAKPTAAALAGAGRALLASKDAVGAVPFLEKSVAADPKSARFRAWLGVARVASDAAVLGRRDLAAAQKLDPADVEVVRAVVEERLTAGDPASAEKAAAAFAKARKDHPFGPFLLALVADQAKRYDDAIALYQRAIALDGGLLDARRNLIIVCVTQNPVYQNAKRTRIALDQLESYVKLGGRDASIRRLAETLPQFFGPEAGPPKGEGEPTKPAK